MTATPPATSVDHRRANLLSGLALAAVVIVLTLPVTWGGVRLGQDTATQFYPWYANLGERLRQGGVPEWNPHQFSGAPLAGDPQSGWMYLPAMLLFTLLPLSVAVVAQVATHLALAASGSFLLARRVGLGHVGALVAATAFAGSGVLYGRIPSGPASYQVLAWLPWVLLGAEVALRAPTWWGRVAGWALAGFAVSQALVAWAGQVSYYVLLLLAAWVLFRVLWGADGRHRVTAPVRSLALPPRWRPVVSPTVLGRLLMHGLAMLAVGLGLGAAGLLPRLEFNAVSNASGGEYATEVGGVIGGSSGDDVLGRLFQPSIYYPGAAVLALAVVGIVLGRGRYGVPFWLVTAVGAIVLTIPSTTPLHWLLYLLPMFRTLHEHWPERVILVAFPGLAIMAGAGAQALVDGARTTQQLGVRLVSIALPGAILAAFAGAGQVAWVPVAAVAAVTVIVATRLLGPATTRLLPDTSPEGLRTGRSLTIRFPSRHSGGRSLATHIETAPPTPHGAAARPSSALGRALPALLVLVVLVDLVAMNEQLAGQAPFGGFHRREITPYYAPSGAAAWLRDRYESEGPFRFAGYDPSVRITENGQPVLYRYQFADPYTQSLAVNNRATVLGLEDTQGYNPLQLENYVEVVEAINGGPQEYHGADIYPTGVGSPLLDLLGVRYLVVPATYGPERTDLAAIDAAWPTVYGDGSVRIVENPRALPRAWVVSELSAVPDGEALRLLATGASDPRTTALVETSPGEAAPDPGPLASGTVTLLASDDPDTIRLTTSSDGTHLVVLSELAYPAWRATIDGADADLLTVDHGLMGIVVPAGTHEVTIRYDSLATRAGLGITGGTALLLAVLLLAVSRRRPGRPA